MQQRPAALFHSSLATQKREDASEEANPELTKEARAQFYTHTNADFKRFDPSDLPPIEVYGATAVCDGHPLEGLGHPREFIRTDYAYPVRCKYCGTHFQRVHMPPRKPHSNDVEKEEGN